MLSAGRSTFRGDAAAVDDGRGAADRERAAEVEVARARCVLTGAGDGEDVGPGGTTIVSAPTPAVQPSIAWSRSALRTAARSEHGVVSPSSSAAVVTVIVASVVAGAAVAADDVGAARGTDHMQSGPAITSASLRQ